MTKTIFKSIILVILVAISIYQTALLWFDYPSDRNFFYTFIDEENANLNAEEVINYDFFLPEKIAVYLGSSVASYRLKMLTKSDDVELTNDNIRQILNALTLGNPIEETIPLDQLWEKQHILYMMPFSISKTMIEANFGSVGSWMPDDFLIDRIYIYPSENIDDLVFIFADKTLDNRIGCTLPIEDEKIVNNALLRYMEQTIADNGINYISTKQNGLNSFVFDQLLPSNSQSLDLLENLYSDRYFYEEISRNDEAIEQFADYFFDFPENKWTIVSEDDMRFGDLYAIVSYSTKGLFEYKLIEEIESKKTTLNKSFSVAKSFLLKDSLLGQIEYYLDDYSESETGYTFYFNYMYRGIPLIFDRMKTEFELYYPMQITVVGNTVTSYQRLLWKNQELLIQGNPIEVVLQKPIDDLLAFNPEANGTIEDMYLAYHVEELSDGAYLKWIIDLEKVRYFSELE